MAVKDADYQRVHIHESEGALGSIGLKIFVACPSRELPQAVKDYLFHEGERLYGELLKGLMRADPGTQGEYAEWVANLTACFPESQSIHVRTIDNQYCKQVCCIGRPWLRVTTRCGEIVIGPRKRVLSIDWSGSDITATADELFPAEDTTKYDRLIHAWGLEKAKEYVHRLLRNDTK